MTTAPNTGPSTSAVESRTVEPVDRRPRWATVARREIIVQLTDRNVLISTGLTLALLVISLGLQAFLAVRSHEYTVAVVSADAAALVTEANDLDRAAGGSTTLRPRTVADPSAGEAAVTEETSSALLTVTDNRWSLVGNTSPEQPLIDALSAALRHRALTQAAAAEGVAVDELVGRTTLGVRMLHADAENAMFFRVTGLVFAMLFYIASLLFGLVIANSVVQEKQSRIVEILASAISLRDLLTGKLLGNLVLALGQMVLYVGAGLIGLAFTPWKGLIPGIAGAAGWFLVFFVLGFVALAALWAVAGALATRTEDVQSTSAPLTMIIVFTLFAGLLFEGVALRVASYVPIMSSIAMPRRLLDGSATWWEALVSLGITAAFAVLAVRVGSMIYRRSLLQTHGRLSLRQAWALDD